MPRELRSRLSHARHRKESRRRRLNTLPRKCVLLATSTHFIIVIIIKAILIYLELLPVLKRNPPSNIGILSTTIKLRIFLPHRSLKQLILRPFQRPGLPVPRTPYLATVSSLAQSQSVGWREGGGVHLSETGLVIAFAGEGAFLVGVVGAGENPLTDLLDIA